MKSVTETIEGLGAVRVIPGRPSGRAPVLLLHGIGLGAWFWERDQQILAAAGLESIALDLPGHGADAGNPRSLDDIAEGARRVAQQLDAPAIVGHSMGGLVAQMIAQECGASALVLMCSATPAGVKALPPPRALLSGIRLVPGALGRGTFVVPDDLYRATGFSCVTESDLPAILPRMVPWSSQASRALFLRRPRVQVPDCPVLVTFGLRDALVPGRASRLLGDFFNAVTWRFDDLGHMPPLEPGGERHAAAVARWISAPTRRRVQEVDAFAPEEGVGEQERGRRRSPRAPRSHSRFRKRDRD